MIPSLTSIHKKERVSLMLPQLPDELLLDAYSNALRLQLEREFVLLLRTEIRRRSLSLPKEMVF